jgi:PilZ domain
MPKPVERKHDRIDFRRPGFVILEPDAPWIECAIADISEGGVCLDVGALFVPEIFVLVLNPSGTVRRACWRMWRQGELVGARFVTAKQLRDGLRKAKPGAKLKARRQA